MIKSFEPGEDWGWCYADEEMIDDIGPLPGESAPEHYAPPGHA